MTETLLDYTYSTGILMSTLWNQSGLVNISGNTTISYNQYCPTDPTTGRKSVTGCTNTASSQIIYYYIEEYGLDLQLSLNSSDAYTSSYNSVTISIKADGSTPGTISFAEINSKLADFDLKSADDIAALNYACGVVSEAGYGSSATGTSWNLELFYRSGFTCVVEAPMWHSYYIQKYWSWGNTDSQGKYRISSEGYEVLIENLTAGNVVGVSIPGHALVIDGYNADNDTFHINYGWGNSSNTRWYTREEMYAAQYHDFLYDFNLGYVSTFTVSDSEVYGSNTFIRAWEQANGMRGTNTITFTDSTDGVNQVWQNYLTVSDTTIVEHMNIDVMVVNSVSSWGFGFYDEGYTGKVTFNDFSGSLIVNTDKSQNAAFYWDDAMLLDFSGA